MAVAVKKNFSVLSCLALLQVASSAFAEESKQQTEIDADVRKSTITSYEPTYAPELIELKNGKGCTGLSKPFEYKSGPRIVVGRDKSIYGVLNPQEPEYPKSQPLKSLSYEEAIEIFGHEVSDKDGVKSFPLMLQTYSLEYRRKHQCLLEAKFENNVLGSYRISGEMFPNTNWQTVK